MRKKNKKVIGVMKDKLGGKIMKEFIGLTATSYSYLLDNVSENKKSKGAKNYVIKRKLIFKKYKNSFRSNST